MRDLLSQGAPRARPMPLYERVKSFVVENMASGAWPAGEKLPSEHELAATLNVSRLTVHRALRELAASGALQRLPGVGTFVAPAKPVSAIVRIHNIADEIRGRGERFSASIHRLVRTPATAALAALFGIARGDALFHSLIIYRSDGVPLQLEDRHVLPAFAPEFLQQDFASRSTTDYLQGIARPTDAHLVIEALMPEAEARALLKMPKGEPCLGVTRTTWVDGRVTTFTRFLHPASRYRMSSGEAR